MFQKLLFSMATASIRLGLINPLKLTSTYKNIPLKITLRKMSDEVKLAQTATPTALPTVMPTATNSNAIRHTNCNAKSQLPH